MRHTNVIDVDSEELELEFEEVEDLNVTRKLYLDDWGMPSGTYRECSPTPDPPESPRASWQQDTDLIEGGDAIDPPPGSELVQRGLIQG